MREIKVKVLARVKAQMKLDETQSDGAIPSSGWSNGVTPASSDLLCLFTNVQSEQKNKKPFVNVCFCLLM